MAVKLMMIQRKKNSFWKLLKATWPYFIQHRLSKLSAALSYYTIFALPPMLVIVISLCSIFFGREAIQGEIFGAIRSYVGNETAFQLEKTLSKITLEQNNYLATIMSIITLLFGATGVFGEIQDSINFTWGIKAKPKKGFIRLLLNRLISFSMIIVLGFILMVSLSLNILVDILMNRIKSYFPDILINITYILNLAIIYLTISTLFACIFKVLPDAKIKWRYVIPGALATGLLFLGGKYLISLYLSHTSVASIYGAAGSVILLLLWVYYSAIILYFGAEFTQVYVRTNGIRIEPTKYSVFIENFSQEKKSNL